METGNMPEDRFLKKVKEIILAHLEDDSFGVANLAREMGLSRSQLFRKLKSCSNFSANQLIRNIRLAEACKLIEEDSYTVSEVAYKVGFSSPSYFNKCFHDQYGCAPSDYLKTRTSEEPSTQKRLKPAIKIVIPVLLILTVILLLSILRSNSNISLNAASINDHSIAVMPLLDLSANKQREHIAVGLTDAIILELSRIKNLRVISRGSAMLFQDSVLPYSNIAEQLGVNLLLEGSIVYNGDSMRVTVQLIEPFPEEKHLWANKYEESSLNMIHLSNDISNAIANEIELVVDDSKKTSSVNPEVYDLYLKAHHLWLTQKPQSIRDAMDYLQQSMAIDSGYAPAYSLLAECYISLNKFIRNNDEKLKNRQSGRAAIDKALKKAIEIDGSLAEAYITKGNILGKFDYNWEGMKTMVEKGLKLNLNNSTGYIALYYYYSVKGELDKCIAMAHKAEELDPLNPRTLNTVANAYVLA